MKRKILLSVFICLLVLSYSGVNAQCSPQNSNSASCSRGWGGGWQEQTYYITPEIPINVSAYVVVNYPANVAYGVGGEVVCGNFFWNPGSNELGTHYWTRTISASDNTDGALDLWVSSIEDSYVEISATW